MPATTQTDVASKLNHDLYQHATTLRALGAMLSHAFQVFEDPLDDDTKRDVEAVIDYSRTTVQRLADDLDAAAERADEISLTLAKNQRGAR
jgi:hypothetical protein